MDLGLRGRIALATGASQEPGHAIAPRLAGEGFDVVAAARNTGNLAKLCAKLEGLGARGLVHPDDPREPYAPSLRVAATEATFGRSDLGANNAAATVRGDFLRPTGPMSR